MSISDIVQLLTAIAALIGALGSLMNGGSIRRIHKAVNSTAQKQNRRTDQLTAALTDADIPVPPRDPPEGDEPPWNASDEAKA